MRVAAAVAIIGLLLFNPLWTTTRFSSRFGEFLSMQLAYDEPYYFWQLSREVAEGALDISYRLFSKLLGVALLGAGASYDTMVTVYGLLNPVLAFASAVFLAATWERRSLGRLIWALLLLFSFDFLSGSSRVVDYDPPAVWLADLVGQPALLKPDVDMPPIINEYVITCMDAAGYELAPFGTSGCALSEERNIRAACYLARGSRDWWKKLFQ